MKHREMEEDGWKRKENLAGGYHTSAPFSHENYNCLYFLIFYNNLIFRILLSEANIQKYHFSQVSSSLSRLYNNWIISLSLSHCHTLPITMHITNSRVLIFFKKGQPSASCVKIELLHCVISEPSLLTVNKKSHLTFYYFWWTYFVFSIVPNICGMCREVGSRTWE